MNEYITLNINAFMKDFESGHLDHLKGQYVAYRDGKLKFSAPLKEGIDKGVHESGRTDYLIQKVEPFPLIKLPSIRNSR